MESKVDRLSVLRLWLAGKEMPTLKDSVTISVLAAQRAWTQVAVAWFDLGMPWGVAGMPLALVARCLLKETHNNPFRSPFLVVCCLGPKHVGVACMHLERAMSVAEQFP